MKKRSTTTPQDTNEIHRTDDQILEIKTGNLKQLFDEMASGFALHEIICDEQGKPVDYRFLQMNTAFERQTGLVAGDLLGKRALEVLPGLEPFWIETYGRVALTGQPERFEKYSNSLDKTFSVVAYCPEHGKFTAIFEDITERKQANDKLIASQQRLQNVLQNSPDAIYAIDLSTQTTIFFNRDEFLGYSKQDLEAPGSIMTRVHPDDLPGVSQNWSKAITCKEQVPFEFRLFNKGGEIVWIKQRITVISNNLDGSPAQILLTLTDITERKQAEDELRLSEEKYHSLFNFMSEGVAINELVLDEKGNVIDYIIVDANPGFELNTPYKIKDVLGRRASEIYKMSPEYIQTWWQLNMDMSAPAYTELYHEPSQRWQAITTTRPVGKRFYTIFADITESKQSLQLIEESNESLSLALKASNAGTYDWDIVNDTFSWSPEFYNIFGLPEETVVGFDTWKKALHPDDVEAAAARIQESIDEKTELVNNYRIILPSGEVRHIRATGKTYYDADQKPLRMVGLCMDITPLVQAEQKLQENSGNMQAILDSSLDSVFLIEPDGTILAANLGLGERFGRNRDELIGSNTYDLLPKEVADHRRKFMDQVIASGKPTRFEDERSGITIENSIYPVLNEQGKVTRLAIFGRDVTERMKAERSLAESEERFRLMIENAPLGYQSLDIDGNFIHVNPVWLELLGYEREEVIGRWFGEFLVPDHRDAFRENFPIFKAAGQIRSEFEMLHKNGSKIFVAFEGRIGFDATGKFKQTHCMLQDITEKRRFDENIRQSEAELKKAQSYAHVGSWVWNIKTGSVEWSDEMYNIFGISKENFSGNLQEVVASAIHPDDRKKVEASNSSVANEGKPIPLEYRILRPDANQRVVWAEAGELELDEEGKPALLRGIIMDITERKQAEESLRESEAKFHQMFDISPVGIVMVGLDKRFILCNHAFSNSLGYETEELVGKLIKDVTLPEDNHIGMAEMKAIMKGEITISQAHKRYIRKEGQVVWGEVTISLIRDSEGHAQYFLAIIQDITDRKLAEDEIHRRVEELEGLQKTVLDITAAQSLPGLLESIVERACQLVGAPGGSLYLTDPEKREVRCDVSYNTPINYVGVVLNYGEGVAGEVAQTGQPLYVEDYKNWAGRAQSFEVDKLFSTVLGVPLLWGGQVRGVIDVIHYKEGESFRQEDKDLLTIFAGHAAIAIENSRLLEASQADQIQVRELSTRLAEAEENERRRIARELHDQVGQSLSALSINMNIMHSQVPEFLPGFKRRLDDSLMLIDQTTDHIRHLMSELRPAVLDDYGLKAALDWAVGSITKRTNLNLLVEGECNRFPPRVEIALFRIAQEALGNITRHAHARNVKILLSQDGPDMSMSIADDGVGFDPSNITATERSGWGLRLMAERAESIGASLKVESTPGTGTCITARYHDENSTGR